MSPTRRAKPRNPDHPVAGGKADQPGFILALQEGSRQVLAHDDFKETAFGIYAILKKALGSRAGYVALLSRDGLNNELVFLDAGGLSCSVDPSLPMPVRGMRAEAYRTGTVVFHNDFPHSTWAPFLPPNHARLDNVLFAPLKIKGKTIGVIGLANKPGGFSEDDARLAEIFGELGAIAFANITTLNQLRSSEEHFRAVAQTAHDAIITADGDGRIVFWNARAAILFGYGESEALGRPVTLIIPQRFRERHCAALDRTRVTGLYHLAGRTMETAGRRRDGSELPLELSLSVWEANGEVRFTAIIRDISSRQSAEAALKASEERYRVIFENATEGIIVADPRTRDFYFANPTICRLFGYTPEEFLQRNISELHPESELPQVFAEFDALARAEKSVVSAVPCLRKDGRLFFADVTAAIMELGNRPFLVGFFTDITERKRAEEALLQAQEQLEERVRKRTRELTAAYRKLEGEAEARRRTLEALEASERKFRAIFNQTFQFIGLLAPDGTILEINQTTLEFFGRDYRRVVGRPLWELNPLKTPPEIKKRIIRAVKEAAAGHFVRFEFPLVLPGDQRLSLDFSIKPVFNNRGKVELLIPEGRDVTELKRTEEALRVSEGRLRLLSTQILLTQENERKRVAKDLHDGIGQYLSAIKYRVENALVRLNPTAPNGEAEQSLRDMVPVIQGAIDEIRRICLDLRPSILDDLGIIATLSWFTREFQKTYNGTRIRHKTDLEESQVEGPLKIVIFRIVQEALNNVAKHSQASRVTLHLGIRKQQLLLEIKDNGRGFHPRQVKLAEQEGRGLGLASMKERAELFGGSFTVQSGEGRGTRIRVAWPTKKAPG